MTPIIVTALFGKEDFAWLDGLRRRHYPRERNQVPAHLTLFHHLPPRVGDELKQRLVAATRRRPPPRAWLAGVIALDRGVALRVDSPELEAIRAALAEAFAPLLIAQDRAGWRPHVTIQNKADPAEARRLRAELDRDFTRRPLAIAGLATWRYEGGPWAPLGRYMFGG